MLADQLVQTRQPDHTFRQACGAQPAPGLVRNTPVCGVARRVCCLSDRGRVHRCIAGAAPAPHPLPAITIGTG